MVILYCFAGIIPILIFLHSFRTLDKRIRNSRLKHAVISILNIIYITVVITLILSESIAYDTSNYWITIVPFVFCFFSFISYQIGKKEEKKIEADIIAENSYDVMDLRKNGKRQVNIDIHS